MDPAELLTVAASLPDNPGHDALRELAPALREIADTLEPSVLEQARVEERLFLAEHPDGPLLALRWYPPGYCSTVHSHAWTVLLGLAGSGTLERFVLSDDGRAQRVSAEATDAPHVAPIDGGEIHRQLAGPDGTLELVVIGDYDANAPHAEYAE